MRSLNRPGRALIYVSHFRLPLLVGAALAWAASMLTPLSAVRAYGAEPDLSGDSPGEAGGASDPAGPHVCVGFNGLGGGSEADGWNEQDWGYLHTVSERPFSCPPDHAFMAAAKSRGTQRAPEHISVLALCCPLPRGVLGSETVYVTADCPPDHVGVGGRMIVKDRSKERYWEDAVYELECRKIDTDRYALGPPRKSWTVVEEEPMLGELGAAVLGEQTEKISWSRLPAAIRYGVRRHTFIGWGLLSCIGDPPGSLYVGKRSRNCDGTYFSQLLDRATGTPVKVLPDCEAISDPFDPHPRCITAPDSPAPKPREPVGIPTHPQ